MVVGRNGFASAPKRQRHNKLEGIQLKRWYGPCRALLAGLITLAAVPGAAQNYPAKSLRLVVPYSTGASTDLLAGALDAALRTPDISGKLVPWGFDPWFAAPQTLAAFGATERQRYRDQVKKFGSIEN